MNKKMLQCIVNKGKEEIIVLFHSGVRYPRNIPFAWVQELWDAHPTLDDIGMIIRKEIPAVVISINQAGKITFDNLYEADLRCYGSNKKLRFYDIALSGSLSSTISNDRLRLFVDKTLSYFATSPLYKDCHSLRKFVGGANPSLEIDFESRNGNGCVLPHSGLLLSFASKMKQNGGKKTVHSGLSLTKEIVLAKQNGGFLYLQSIDDLIEFRCVSDIHYQFPDLNEWSSYCNFSEEESKYFWQIMHPIYPGV